MSSEPKSLPHFRIIQNTTGAHRVVIDPGMGYCIALATFPHEWQAANTVDALRKVLRINVEAYEGAQFGEGSNAQEEA